MSTNFETSRIESAKPTTAPESKVYGLHAQYTEHIMQGLKAQGTQKDTASNPGQASETPSKHETFLTATITSDGSAKPPERHQEPRTSAPDSRHEPLRKETAHEDPRGRAPERAHEPHRPAVHATESVKAVLLSPGSHQNLEAKKPEEKKPDEMKREEKTAKKPASEQNTVEDTRKNFQNILDTLALTGPTIQGLSELPAQTQIKILEGAGQAAMQTMEHNAQNLVGKYTGAWNEGMNKERGNVNALETAFSHPLQILTAIAQRQEQPYLQGLQVGEQFIQNPEATTARVAATGVQQIGNAVLGTIGSVDDIGNNIMFHPTRIGTGIVKLIPEVSAAAAIGWLTGGVGDAAEATPILEGGADASSVTGDIAADTTQQATTASAENGTTNVTERAASDAASDAPKNPETPQETGKPEGDQDGEAHKESGDSERKDKKELMHHTWKALGGDEHKKKESESHKEEHKAEKDMTHFLKHSLKSLTSNSGYEADSESNWLPKLEFDGAL